MLRISAKYARNFNCVSHILQINLEITLHLRTTVFNLLLTLGTRLCRTFPESAERADRVRYLYLLGRARNVQPDHSREAEELLSRATKLDHRHTAAWNELGACLWKREDATAAGNCFERALESVRAE